MSVGFFDTGGDCLDLKIEDGKIKMDEGLETASLISLFSDRFVADEDLPSNINENRGWWGDAISDPADDEIGSILWIHEAVGKITFETRNSMRESLRDALEWMIEDGIAERIEASGELINGEILISAQIFRPQGDNILFKFVWDGQSMKMIENGV